MIDSNVIEWLDFGDSTQKIDAYILDHKKKLFRFFRELLKNKNFPNIEIIFMIIYFIQLMIISISIDEKNDFIIGILTYLKNIFLFSEIIDNGEIYKKILIIISAIIIIDILLIFIIMFSIKYFKPQLILVLINFINIIIFYYLLGPCIEICLLSFWCENNQHKIFKIKCYSGKIHLSNIIFSIFILVLYILISFMYSLYCNEIGTIFNNGKEKTIRIHSNYDNLFNIIKIIINILYFILKTKRNIFIVKIIYESCILVLCLIMFIYSYKYLYYYNNIINYIIYFGWSFNFWFSLCILCKILFNLDNLSVFICIGWIIIGILIYRYNKMKEFLLLSGSDIFEFNTIKSIEIYKNILLSKLKEKNKLDSRILLYGNIKTLEEYIENNPEIHYQYHKLLNDHHLKSKFDNEIDLPILSIIYVLYTVNLEKSEDKLILSLYMSYFLINRFKNVTYAILLCSKIKASSHIGLYYKYLLSEDIKEYLSYKLDNVQKEKIKNLQIGSIILYYLYTDIFKMRIYDAVVNRIDYFDILKNNITSNKSTKNLLKLGETIRKTRKVIMKVWDQLIEINAFSDEPRKYYMIYIDVILRDDFLSKNETKKYTLLKNSKMEEKLNTYHSMFLNDTSSIILADGYLSNGKILYSSENFPLLFNYNVKELLSLTIEDLLPITIQPFHKELIDNGIKYSNINFVYKQQLNSLLKNKNGRLVNIKLFVKPNPNLSYGLTYFIYIQKIHESNDFIIVLDKNLKINGFSEITGTGTSFTIDEGYNLNQSLYGYHIGIILPDILPLLIFKDEEFSIINNGLELKGYLYQVHNLNNLKSKVDIILDKIKMNKSNNNIEIKIEDNRKNINDEFNELIKELNSENKKPYSIFYRPKLYSFLDGKYKYYRLYIDKDIITEDENNQDLPIKYEDVKNAKLNDINNSKIGKSLSKFSIGDDKNTKGNNKKIIINNINFEKNNIESLKDNENDVENEKNEGKEIKENDGEKNIDKNNNSSSQEKFANCGIDKLKMDIVNRRDTIQIKMMKYLCLIFWIVTLFFFIYEETAMKNKFQKLSNFLLQNIHFNITKMNVAVIYITTTNIKWQTHLCNLTGSIDRSQLNKKLITENIDYLLIGKNETNYFYEEYNEILEKRYNVELRVYGSEEKEVYQYNLDNLITFFINSGIKILEKYDSFIERINETKEQIDPLVYGINELLDLIDQTWQYYFSDLNGFKGEEKTKKINKIYNNVPIIFIINTFLSIIIFTFYLMLILHIHKFEIYFLEKLINFNSTNFEGFLIKLNELKKKFRNESNEDEDKEDIENEFDSKMISKNEEDNDKNENQKENLQNNLKSNKKHKKKDGNKQKQKKNKIKLMTFFFIKENISFGLKILLILIISLTYYILSVLIGTNKKNNLLAFDIINEEMIGIFKESFDNYISLKKELVLYEDSLKNCKIVPGKQTYKMNIPLISEIKTPNLGNNLVTITGESGFSQKTMDNFTELFSGNACPVLSHSAQGLAMCSTLLDGVLKKGMEQTLTKMGSIIGTIIEELNTINNKGKEFNEIINTSSLSLYEAFIEFYYQRAYLVLYEIFAELRSEKLNSIQKILRIILIGYIILLNLLVLLLIYFIYYTNNIFNSFLNFIWILPVKYLSEDENFYKEVIKFGNDSF